MIKLSRDGATVKLTVGSKVAWSFHFTHSCSDEAYAALLQQSINERLGDHIEQIRRDAYNQGWKDKSSKRAKATWFSRTFTTAIL